MMATDGRQQVVSENFKRQLEGYGLTTAQILYRLPGPSVPAADLCLAGLRPLPEISRSCNVSSISGWRSSKARCTRSRSRIRG